MQRPCVQTGALAPPGESTREALLRHLHLPTRRRKAEAALQELVKAVEAMAHAEPQELFAGNYYLSTDMVQGGQALVVFGRGRGAGMRQHAIKCAPGAKTPAPRHAPPTELCTSSQKHLLAHAR